MGGLYDAIWVQSMSLRLINLGRKCWNMLEHDLEHGTMERISLTPPLICIFMMMSEVLTNQRQRRLEAKNDPKAPLLEKL